jgi:hypothetical protein
MHLSHEAYMDVARAIFEAAMCCGDMDVDDSASGSLESAKQIQPDSVFTLQVRDGIEFKNKLMDVVVYF